MVLAIICFTLLPRNMQSSKYFTTAEKHCSSIRLQREAEVETVKFSWSATLKPLTNWHTWMFGLMALFYGVAAASISNFLPTMIKRLTKDTITANLYTIAPNLNGAIWIVAMCWVSRPLPVPGFLLHGRDGRVDDWVYMSGHGRLSTSDGTWLFLHFHAHFWCKSQCQKLIRILLTHEPRHSHQRCWSQPGRPATSRTTQLAQPLWGYCLDYRTLLGSSPPMPSDRKMRPCIGPRSSCPAAVKVVWSCWQDSLGSTIAASTSSLTVAKGLRLREWSRIRASDMYYESIKD